MYTQRVRWELLTGVRRYTDYCPSVGGNQLCGNNWLHTAQEGVTAHRLDTRTAAGDAAEKGDEHEMMKIVQAAVKKKRHS